MNAEQLKNIEKQVRNIKTKYPGTIVLVRTDADTRYYMSINEDAEKVSGIIGIQPGDDNTLKFAHTKLDVYLPAIIKSGYRVAIIDNVL